MFQFLTLATLVWGALAFGAEYSWAYAPLLVLCVTAGLLGLSISQGRHFPSGAVTGALVSLVIVGAFQLVPLPARAIAVVSPEAAAANYAELYAKATMQRDAMAASSTPRSTLSIAPGRTLLGLVFLSVMTLLFVGSVRGMSTVGPRDIARGIMALGVLVALLQVMQRANGSHIGYGFWSPPPTKIVESAPFINRNHTAGWLLMALGLSAGHFCGAVTGALRAIKPDWRHRILWLSSRDASETVLTGFAVAVIAIAIVATASRSGAACLALVVIAFGCWAGRALPSGPRRTIVIALLVVILVAAVSIGGVEILAVRLRATSWSNLDGRVGVWRDTLRIVRDFPLTGTGLNTYGIAMLHYQTVNDGYLYIESHNDYLKILAEGGLLLGVPILITAVLFITEIWRRFREAADDTHTYWLRAGAVIGLCAIAIQELSDFTLQMPGAAALFVVLAAIAIHRPTHVSQPSRHASETRDGIAPNVE